MPEPEATVAAPEPPPRPILSEQQRADEKRAGRFAAVGTILAAVVFAVGQIMSQSANKGAPDLSKKAAEALRFANDHSGAILNAAIVQGLGLALMVFTTTYLYRATKARWPVQHRIVLITGIIGPLAFGLGTIGVAASTKSIASDFAKDHPASEVTSAVAAKQQQQTRQLRAYDRTHNAKQTATFAEQQQAQLKKFKADQVKKQNDEAKDSNRTTAILILGAIATMGLLSLVFWLIKGSYDAMKVGLIPRAMGIVGIILGPAFIFGIGVLLLPFWLLAIAFVFLQVLPDSSFPAWRTGQAQEWTGFGGAGARMQREQIAAKQASQSGGERNGEVEAVGPGVKQGDDGDDGGGSSGGTATTPRKRKRRN